MKKQEVEEKKKPEEGENRVCDSTQKSDRVMIICVGADPYPDIWNLDRCEKKKQKKVSSISSTRVLSFVGAQNDSPHTHGHHLRVEGASNTTTSIKRICRDLSSNKINSSKK